MQISHINRFSFQDTLYILYIGTMGGEMIAVIFTLLELWLLSHTGAPAGQGEQGEDTGYLATANISPQ